MSTPRTLLSACVVALLAAGLGRGCGGSVASATVDEAGADAASDAIGESDAVAGDVTDGGSEPIGYHEFTDPRFWTVAKVTSLGLEPRGAAFDGRYVYWAGAPIARLDTKGEFDAWSSWSTFAPPADDGSPARSGGATFDASRYVYFSGRPLRRYDTNADFHSPSSWASFDPGPWSFHVAREGIEGGAAVIAGAAFFVDTGPVVHRCATLQDFEDPSAWSSLDVSTLSPEATCLGGGVLAFPPYVYFNACGDRVDDGATFPRYDTRLPFAAAASWQFVRLGDVGAGAVGYARLARDARYVYLVPAQVGAHGYVLRYDTQRAFVAASFETFDTQTIPSAPAEADVYRSSGWDGRYVYMLSGQLARYDTALPFANAGSWANAGNPYGLDAWAGMIFDGQYMYFATLPPADGGSSIARFDARYPPQMPLGFTGSFY